MPASSSTRDPACAATMNFGGTSFHLNTTGTTYLPNAWFYVNGAASVDGGQEFGHLGAAGTATAREVVDR